MSFSFWTQYALALAVVGLMLVGVYVIMQGLRRGRVFGSAGRRLITVLESTMLSQHTAVHVVKAGSRYLLIGASNGAVVTLAELPTEEVDAWLVQQRATGKGARSLIDAVRALRGQP